MLGCRSPLAEPVTPLDVGRRRRGRHLHPPVDEVEDHLVGGLTIWARIRDAGEEEIGSPGGRVTNAVGTIFRKIFVGTQARPI